MKQKFSLLTSLFLALIIISCNRANSNQETAGHQMNADKKSVVTNKPISNTPAQIFAKPEVPVLCYHRITEGRKGDYTVSPAIFSAHIKILADSGYHAISPAQLYDYLVYNKALPTKPVMITFDDSRSEHRAIAAPVLEKYGFRGVFFIMTITYDKKNYMTRDQIAQLVKNGHTVGLHSWDHIMVTKYKDAEDWKKEVTEPKIKLEKIIGRPVEYWAYPNGVYNHRGCEELNKHFKLSFILSTKRDSLIPLQTVRRIIIPECTPQGLLKSMNRTFGK